MDVALTDRHGMVNALHWAGTQLLAATIAVVAYVWILANGAAVQFIPGFVVLAVSAVVIFGIQYRLHPFRFWMEIPAFFTVYILLALFLPVLWLYSSEFLKVLLDWNDTLILQACGLGLILIQGLWISYDLGKAFLPKLRSTRRASSIPIQGVYILIGISIFASFLAVVTGTFGVLESRDYARTANFMQYIDLMQQLGILGLIVLTYQHPHRKGLIALFVVLLFSIGLASAQKQSALMPILTVGVTYYFRTRKLPGRWIVTGLVAVAVAFSVVSMIRQFYFDRFSGGVTSVSEVVEISSNALNVDEFNKTYETFTIGDQVLMRLFYGNAISKAIAYCERKGFGVPNDNSFKHVLAAPVYAVVPRIIYPGKPLSNFGNWFASHVVVGVPVKYAIGITPVGYGYMIGGALGVLLVGVTLGLFMALLFNVLFHKFYLIYIFCIIRMILPPDVTWEYVAGSIKLVVVAWVVLELLRLRLK